MRLRPRFRVSCLNPIKRCCFSQARGVAEPDGWPVTGIMWTIPMKRVAAPPPEDDSRSTSIYIDRIGKRYGFRWVLSGVSAAVTHGRVLGVAGPNGSGKSTVIRIVADLLRPDMGTVRMVLGGRDVTGVGRRSVTGWVSPEYGLYPALTGAEHVEFFGRLHGLPITQDFVTEALRMVGLERSRNAAVASYSSGMKQRLKFACATVHDPSVLLLDEPFMALDADGVLMVEALVARQRSRGVTILAGNTKPELALADSVVELGAQTTGGPCQEPEPREDARA